MFYFLHRKKLYLPMFFAYAITMWFFILFSMVYTGIMGWNMTPESELELFLDNVTTAGYLLSLVMFAHSFIKGIKQEEAIERKS